MRYLVAALLSVLWCVSASAQGMNGSAGFSNPNVSSVTNNFNLNQSAVLYQRANNSTGTGTNLIAKVTATGVQTATTSDTTGPLLGICDSGCAGNATSANATIAIVGLHSCVFDGGITINDFVILSTTTNGDCSDGGSTVPANVSVIGSVVSATNAAAGTYTIDLNPFFLAAQIVQQVQNGNQKKVSLGTFSSGTQTIDCTKGSIQFATNGGAFTLGAPSKDGACDVLITNNASAGTISFSGFTEGASTGDALDTTNTHLFTFGIWCINGTCGYRVAAHQ